MAAGLFFYASAAVRFIESSDHPIDKSLALITWPPQSGVKEGRPGINILYTHTLEQVFHDVNYEGILWTTKLSTYLYVIELSEQGGVKVSGPLWPEPNHNSKRASLYGSSVPKTRQLTRQEDSKAISVLTTNGGDL